MKSTYLFQSRSGNHYLFDKKQKIYVNIPPEQFFVFNHLENNTEIPASVEKKDLDYYTRKYKFFKDNGFFSTLDSKKRFSAKISEDDIKYHLANLKQLTFEITDKCNLNCTYCGYGHLYGDYDQRTGKNLDFSSVEKIFTDLIPYINSGFNISPNDVMYISFYGGEPLMNFDFIKKTVEYLTSIQIKKRIRFSMTTNATLMHKYMDFLIQNRFNLLISIDGDEKGNVYRHYHNGNPAFNKIIENIDLLLKKNPKYFEKYVSFNAVLHNKNNESGILKFLKEKYGKIPSISPLNDSGIKKDARFEFNRMFRNIDEYKLSLNENYQHLKKDLFLNLPSFSAISTFLIKNTKTFFQSIHRTFINEDELVQTPTGTCIPFSKKIYVSVNGKLMFCERIDHKFYVGEADSLNNAIPKIVNDFNRRINRIEKQCQLCCINENCSQCMYYIENLEKSPKCNAFVNEKQFMNYLSSIFSYLEENPNDIDRIKNEVIID